ncbi:MAG: xanthine dehydrogenase family protein molybdopterin-binding subunit, partial [Novosphingobium sp.]|nr:xanthine dehydrogenase family protein molybdopterin-binding subunit [Novosphingobium sp.]
MNAPKIDPGLGVGAQRYIGKRVPRKEDGRLLTGKGTFVDDVVVPGMLHCAFHRSTIARGRIRTIDTSAARSLPGVHAVLTAGDIDAIRIEVLTFFFTPSEVPVPLLARERVSYVGEPVVLVVADDRYLAEDAAGLVTVDYEEEDPVVTIADARTGPPVHPATESNVAQVMGIEDDEELQELLAGAPHTVTCNFTHQRISQAPLETRGLVVTRQGDEELLLYITCQSPHHVMRYMQLALGLPNLSIRVIAKDVGGSFGLKNHAWKEELAVIAASLVLDRPLKWIEDRFEALTASNQCREQEMTLSVGFDKDGRMLGAFADYGVNNGAYPMGADANVAAHAFMWVAYRMPCPGFITRAWYTNTNGLAAYRGPWAIETLTREVLLDVAARRIGIDPVDIRRRNLLTQAELPVTTPMGMVIDDITPLECLEKLVAGIDIPAFRKEQAEARKAGRYLGLGIAAYVEPTASAGSMAPMTGELAQVRIEPTGKVTALMSTHSQGHGTQTTMAQVIADQLGVPYEDVTVFEGDSSRGGFAPGAAGSRQGVIGGGASMKAAQILKDKVKRVAAHLLNANPESVSIENGMVHVAGAGEMTRSLKEIAEIAYGEPHRMPPEMEMGLEAQYRYQPPPMTCASAANACFVEVDAETGFVKILRWVTSEDCGVLINPAVVEGQVAGGLAQGIGMVLLEEMPYDARGNPTAATFKDYLMPTIFDVPDFEYIHANTPAKNEGGFRGVGEGGAIIGPPTLVNAIADALAPFGEIPLNLPLTPSKLMDVIEGRTAAQAAAPAPAPAVVVPAAAEPAAPAAPQAIDGTWQMTMDTPMGAQEMTGRFQTAGEVLTGVLE